MNEFLITGDSCCDVTDTMRENMPVATVPLKITIGRETFLDENVNVKNLLLKIKNCREGAMTACPSPAEWFEKFKTAQHNFAVTISSKLSGSYNSAVMGAKLLKEEYENIKTHIFDSKSAACGEVLITLKIKELIDIKKTFDEIIESVEDFIENMKTFFILEDLGTIIKTGRMSRITGIAAKALHICPIMAGVNGEIVLKEKARGFNNALARLIQIVRESARDFSDKTLIISHCNNLERAKFVMDEIKKLCNFKDILIIKTGGISTVYANNGGIILSY